MSRVIVWLLCVPFLGEVARAGSEVDNIRSLSPEDKHDKLETRAFIFVGGMPQSGTSFVRQILKTPSFCSGMDSCEKNTRCAVFNIEGQWLLEPSKMKERLYKSGNEENFLTADNVSGEFSSDVVSAQLLHSWGRYWDFSRPFLLEKSPPNLSKMW